MLAFNPLFVARVVVDVLVFVVFQVVVGADFLADEIVEAIELAFAVLELSLLVVDDELAVLILLVELITFVV